MKKRIFWLFLIAVLVSGGAALFAHFRKSEPEDLFRTATASRGDLLITVSATGTVEPEEVVDIGAQVMGRIKVLGDDPRGKTDPAFVGKTVDYGSPVEKGMLLAQIDPAIYKAQLNQAAAAHASAKANLLQMDAKCMQADAEWKRAQRLRTLKLTSMSPTGATGKELPIKGISDADYILAQANYEAAVANCEAAKALILQQSAAEELAQTNFNYTTITSPIDGTILARRVSIGQTVVSSLNAPSLFLIARDLRRMQVWASVNEADIGRLKEGTEVNFRVDAFPDDVFRGKIVQIRLNASMTQNVVTYTVVISTDNSNMRLLPYLSADVKFEVDKRTDALLVPNAALRYQPRAEQMDKAATDAAKAAAKPQAEGQTWSTLWVKQDDSPLLAPLRVRTGLSDGVNTEILEGGLDEKTQLVLGEKRAQEVAGEVNPFAPVRFRGTPKKK